MSYGSLTTGVRQKTVVRPIVITFSCYLGAYSVIIVSFYLYDASTVCASYGLCLCVYHNSVFFQNTRAGQLALGDGGFYDISYTAFRKFGYLPNNVTFFLYFVPNSTLKMARQLLLLRVLYNTRIYFNTCSKGDISRMEKSFDHPSSTSLSY